MISVTVLAVGKLKEPFFAAACDEYAKRLGAYCKFQLLELPEARLPLAEAAIRAAITIQGSPVPPAPLCYAIITREGVQRLA